MKLKTNKQNCLKKDLKIPKGYRLLEDWECLKESKTNEKLKQLLINGYVAVMINGKIGACRLVIFGGNSDFFAYGRSVGGANCSLRGVFVKK